MGVGKEEGDSQAKEDEGMVLLVRLGIWWGGVLMMGGLGWMYLYICCGSYYGGSSNL